MIADDDDNGQLCSFIDILKIQHSFEDIFHVTSKSNFETAFFSFSYFGGNGDFYEACRRRRDSASQNQIFSS